MTSKPDSGGELDFPETHPEPLRSFERAHEPFDWYETARRAGPVRYDADREVYDVFSYEHVILPAVSLPRIPAPRGAEYLHVVTAGSIKAALQDDERLVRKPLARDPTTLNPFSYIDNAMVWSDGTSHGRINHQLFEYFRPDVLADLEDAIEAAAHAQLDAALADGDTFDFASEFAVPVPLRVVMDLVGVPREDLFGRLDEYDLDALLEEVLRHRSPLQSRVRETAAPVTLAGVDVPAGETVVLWLGAANRDPARYDDPDAFRPGRDPDHLAFGSGAHVCIGAPLARLEGPVVVRVLRERLADIDVHDDGLVPKSKTSKLGFERLPVTVTHTVGCNCLPVIRRIFGRIPEMTYNRPYQA